MDHDGATPVPTTIGELLDCLDMVSGISQMPQGTSGQGSSHIGRGSVKPQSNTSTSGVDGAAQRYKSPLLKVMPVEPVSSYLCIWPRANHHIDFGFGQRHGDGSCVSGRIDRQSSIFEDIS